MSKAVYLFIAGCIFLTMVTAGLRAQSDTTIYELTISEEMVNKAGKDMMGMTVNGGIPGPALVFKEGGYAIIRVTNTMDVETSVHWHGLLLPNFMDGVPYLTTPPILPGKTFQYEFPLVQSGTYWYHSHTMLQEQKGVYGSIIIEPKEKQFEYDHDQIVVLSDWTNQKPKDVLRNLKRGNEWYNIKKGTATPLNQVIARRGLGAQVNFWKQRMESADIADVYYPAFLTNGELQQMYTQYKPGDKIRLRVINAAASTQFWITLGGGDPLLVAADGLDVVPTAQKKLFIGIAETYDLIITIPDHGQVELRAMAQDGSGTTHAYFGNGQVISAEVLPRPDKIEMMKQMARMDMRMGAPAMKFNPSQPEPQKLMNNWGMKMKMDMDMGNKKMDGEMGDKMGNEHGDHQGHQMNTHDMEQMDSKEPPSHDNHMGMFSEYNYDYLQAPENTEISQNMPTNNILLNLTGNMWRYIWSMNGIPLAEADKIKINRGEKVVITFNNLTMMHHPMHLHGHFFRVINKYGERSPLKHTVNVAPMQKTIIEFEANEDSDWFLHCHVLYHMMGGMARVVSYQTARDPRLAPFPLKTLINEGNHFYNWGAADIASNMAEINLTSSNTRNQFNLNLEYGWSNSLEGELSYERYLYDYLRVFVGANFENEEEENFDNIKSTAIAGLRLFTPYMFNLDVRIDNQLRPEIRISRELNLFPRTNIFAEFEYQADFGWVNNIAGAEGLVAHGTYVEEYVLTAGAEYFLNRNLSLIALYDTRFGVGGGLSIRF